MSKKLRFDGYDLLLSDSGDLSVLRGKVDLDLEGDWGSNPIFNEAGEPTGFVKLHPSGRIVPVEVSLKLFKNRRSSQKSAVRSRLARIAASEGLLKLARLPADKKDYDRLNSMQTKSMRGGQLDLTKMEQYARAMAKSVTDWGKAERRGSAALMVGSPTVAQIFFDRADELRGGAPAPAAKPQKAPRVAPVSTPPPIYTGRMEKIHCLPMGALNLRNGDNKVFNFLDTWGGDDSHLTVAENQDTGRRIIVTGSGRSGWRPGQLLEMIGDQTQKHMAFLTVVGEAHGKMSQDLR